MRVRNYTGSCSELYMETQLKNTLNTYTKYDVIT